MVELVVDLGRGDPVEQLEMSGTGQLPGRRARGIRDGP